MTYVTILQDSANQVVKIGSYLTELFKKQKGTHFSETQCPVHMRICI